MNVTLFISSLSGGGAERVVVNIANYLAKKKYSVTILTFTNIISYIPDSKVKIVPLYKRNKSILPHFLINIIKVFNLFKYIIFSGTELYISFLPKLTTLILRFRNFIKVPILVAERCDPEKYCSLSKKNMRNFKNIFPKANGYIFQTKDAMDFYSNNGIDVKNSVIIPNAINRDFLNIKKDYSKKTKKVISIGRMTKQKNFDMLLKGFAMFCNNLNGYSLEIYGEGEMLEHYKKLCNELNISNKVTFPGYVNDIQKKICEADVFVLSSDYEGMPNSLMEAMAIGLPVISTDCPVGGPRYLIQNNVNGILIPVGDVEALAESLYKILTNDEFANFIGNNASKIKLELNPEVIYKNWEDFINKNL